MTTNEIATIGIIIGALSPFLTAIVQQGNWPANVRRWVSIGVALVLGIGTVIAGGDFDLTNWVVTLTMVIGAAQVSYAALKPVTDRVEDATTQDSRKRYKGQLRP